MGYWHSSVAREWRTLLPGTGTRCLTIQWLQEQSSCCEGVAAESETELFLDG